MKRIANKIETTELCSYGCGSIAKFINGSYKLMCCERSNACPAVKLKNSASGKKAYSDGRRVTARERYASLPQDKKDKMTWNKGKFTNTIFEYNGSGNHKKYLIQERGHKCEKCGLSTWLDKIITLELEHKDGNNRNNEKVNLQLLCPNCHSYTETWKGRNLVKKKQQEYISDEQFLDALKATKNIRQALISLNLTPKGANYERAYRVLNGGVVKLANTSDLSSDASA